MALNPVCLTRAITLFRIEHLTHTGVGTDDVQSKIGNQNVILVDTPGFARYKCLPHRDPNPKNRSDERYL